MAFIHGIAAGHAALYETLLNFLTTHPDLVAAGQEWSVVFDGANVAGGDLTDKLLRGPGLAGQDQVYVGLRAVAIPASDQYWIEARGATGPMATARHYGDHIKSQPSTVRMFTDSGTIEYWIVANGRRFIVVLKISTVFEAMYAGLFLPYAAPLSYPYPMMVAGSSPPSGYGVSPATWRSESEYHTHFTNPNGAPNANSNAIETSFWLLDPLGQWIRSNSGTTPNVLIGGRSTQGDMFVTTHDSTTYSPHTIDALMLDALGGGRLMTPYTLLQKSPSVQTFGIMDGVFSVGGVANAAENIIQQGGVDHLVVQNVFRSTFYDYWTLRLE